MKARYEKRCQRRCLDRRERPRNGEVWVHIDGETQWVCANCASVMAHAAGIPTAAQKKALEQRKSAVRLPGFEAKPALREPRP